MSNQRDDGNVSGVAKQQPGRREFLLAALAAGTAGAAGSLLSPANRAQAASPGACAPDKAPLRDLDGKVAFITGGSKGIGLAIAEACLKAGMKTVITYRQKAQLDDAMKSLSAFGDRVYSISLDVTNATAVDAAAEDTVRHFGKVHLLVANAGVGVLAPLSAPNTRELLTGAWDVNVIGVYNCVQSFLPKIRAHGEGGQIVASASVEGLFACPMSIYGMTKAAAIYMMEALREELADANIGVSAFCPGAVDSQPGNLDVKGSFPMPDVMKPSEAGQLALEGIRANRLFILTHPEYRGIKDRSDALLASNPRTPVPPARAKFEEKILTSAIYAKEVERLRCASGRRS